MIKVSEAARPEKDKLETVVEAIRNLLKTEIADSEWGKIYLENCLKCPERFAFDLEYVVKDMPKGSRVCDHGSAPFILSTALSMSGFKVTATDVHPERFGDFVKKAGLEIVKVDLDNLTGNEGLKDCFDAVIFNELFEHLRGNLIDTMRFVNDSIVEGGRLYLSTPNLKSMYGIYNFLFKNKANYIADNLYDEWVKIHKFGHMGHVREYIPEEILRFLSHFDFEIEKLIYRGRLGGKMWILPNTFPGLFKAYRPAFSVVAKKVKSN